MQRPCGDGIPDGTPNKLGPLSLLVQEHHHHEHVLTSLTCLFRKVPLQPHTLHHVKVKNSSPTAELTSQDFMMYTVRSITRVSGETGPLLPLIGAAEIISILLPSIRLTVRGRICL